jgi:hypothetical protein
MFYAMVAAHTLAMSDFSVYGWIYGWIVGPIILKLAVLTGYSCQRTGIDVPHAIRLCNLQCH